MLERAIGTVLWWAGWAFFKFGVLAVLVGLGWSLYRLIDFDKLERDDPKSKASAYAILFFFVVVLMLKHDRDLELDGNGETVVETSDFWGLKRDEYRARWQRRDMEHKNDRPFAWVVDGREIGPDDRMPWAAEPSQPSN